MNVRKWSSYSEFYLKSDYAVFHQKHHESRGRFPFRMILVEQGPHNFSDPALDETIIAFPVKVESNCRCSWEMNNRNFSHESRPGDMILLPTGTASKWEVNASRTILVLAVPNRTLQMLVGGARTSSLDTFFESLTTRVWSDPLVEQMMTRLWSCTEHPDVNHTRLADGLVMTVISQLALIAGSPGNPQHISLPQWRLSRVKEYVLENLGKDICVTGLADAAGMSVRHFSRSFQEEVGDTPLKWVMKLRTDRAIDLLHSSHKSINEISIECGFSSQSHFTTTLKKHTGTTPYKIRKSFYPQ